jgi:hypothetical protein
MMARQVVSSAGWVLGDLANSVETQYGEHRLEQFAKDTGVPLASLLSARSVFRAFPMVDFPRGKVSFSAAKALAAHPDRLEILAKTPDISTREAAARTRQWKSEQRSDQPPPVRTKGPEVEAMLREARKMLPELSPEAAAQFAKDLERALKNARRKAQPLQLTPEK